MAVSNGTAFVGTTVKWNDFFCLAGEFPYLGDFNGDGKDDIIVFTKGRPTTSTSASPPAPGSRRHQMARLLRPHQRDHLLTQGDAHRHDLFVQDLDGMLGRLRRAG